ncbi:putative quinol monooxygenase [Sphingobacterium hungaricum]|uniref:Antibiotic biosynthesis monooxygenase n=1 Tax=Sphingobacterium hungaricum TaxID=2082723 RepID=A0A928V1N4_9SPHI|nr:putative quinol monooxygenase [Sphingobacterium hungaricum]MBE8714872.1 antibiotic biosynthesis monooxygenase [Sphingobacterium hungaricum]
MSNKIYLTALIKAKSQHREEIKQILQNLVIETRQEEGCERYDLHQGIDDKDLFTFYEIWKDKEALDYHNNQPYILALAEQTAHKLQEKPVILLTELLD